MGETLSSGRASQAPLSGLAHVAPIDLDMMSDVRHLHANAFKTALGAVYTEQEVQAFREHVYCNSYADQIIRTSCFGAWFDGHLAGTASWSASAAEAGTARIAHVFVDPLYGRSGIGRMLLNHVEVIASESGCRAFVLRTGPHAVPFFEAIGYSGTSHGVVQLTEDVSLAVMFMRKSDCASA